MIDEISFMHDSFAAMDIMGVEHRVTGRMGCEVSMSFRGIDGIMQALQEAHGMGEAEGLRRIADAIDAENESRQPQGPPPVDRSITSRPAVTKKNKRTVRKRTKKAKAVVPERRGRCLDL